MAYKWKLVALLFCCAALNYSLKHNNAPDAAQQHAELAEHRETKFLKSLPEIIGETCLIALTAISYILPRRSDLVPMFEKALADNIDAVLS